MNNVLKSLRYMAENGGRWYGDKTLDGWRVGLMYDPKKRGGYDHILITQDDVREFLTHYDELSNKIGMFDNEINEFSNKIVLFKDRASER